MAFRFLHTADLHLDSPLRSLALRDPDLAGLIAEASRMSLSASVDLALEERLDAVLIAGDLYDGGQTSMKTARFLAREMARLDAAGIRVFIIRGNHDAASQITRELTLPPGVHVFTGRATPVAFDAGALRVAIHGLSFLEPQMPESLLPKYRAPLPGHVNLGMMHTSLGGAAGHDNYAPCTLAELQAHGFDYWALGHIHKRAEYAGRARVVMPGIPQGRDIGEPGRGSVTLVQIDDLGAIETRAHPVAQAAFQPVAVALDGVEGWEDMRRAIRAALEAQAGAAPHLVARLVLRGDTGLAPRLQRDRDLALAEAQEIARALGSVWVEGVRLDLGARAPVAGALGDLARIIAHDIRPGAAYAQALDEVQAGLARALPGELRDAVGTFDDALCEDGIAEILARLAERA